MAQYGPSKSELKFRLALSLAGCALLAAALAYRGLPESPGGWEAIGFAALFFGGTVVWSLVRLMRHDSGKH